MKGVYVILLIVLMANMPVIAQPLNKTGREYFILGTLSDYMGRELDPRTKNLLDRYDALEGPLITAVDSILRIDYPAGTYKVERYKDSTGTLLSGEISSDTLSKRFNAFYTFKESGSLTSDNDPKLNGRPVLMGALRNNIFADDNEKMAFLAGVYVRYGLANDTAWEISIGNSYSKAMRCYHLLQAYKCRPSYQLLPNIPVIHKVYFHPTPKVKAYLENLMFLRKRLNKTRKDYIDKLINSRHG